MNMREWESNRPQLLISIIITRRRFANTFIRCDINKNNNNNNRNLEWVRASGRFRDQRKYSEMRCELLTRLTFKLHFAPSIFVWFSHVHHSVDYFLWRVCVCVFLHFGKFRFPDHKHLNYKLQRSGKISASLFSCFFESHQKTWQIINTPFSCWQMQKDMSHDIGVADDDVVV